MQITWWRNVVCLWCHFLCFSQPQCLSHSLCERHKLACWSSLVCLYSVSVADDFPSLLLNNHLCLDINFFQCSFNTMLSTSYQRFSWSLCTWLNPLSLYRYAHTSLVLFCSNISEESLESDQHNLIIWNCRLWLGFYSSCLSFTTISCWLSWF